MKITNENIKKVMNEYDELLDFSEYAQVMGIFDYNGERYVKICCPLHDENTPSFYYSSARGIWTCFGQCHTTGRVTKFHYLFLKRKDNNITLLQALKDLQSRFPNKLPKINFEYNKQIVKKTLDEKINEFKRDNEIKIELKSGNNVTNLNSIKANNDLLFMLVGEDFVNNDL